MAVGETARSLLGLASLRETRRRLREARWGRPLAVALGALYALLSMLIGQMLILEPIGGDHFWMVLWSGNGTHPWDYPGLLVVGAWGILSLPFFPTIAMVVIAVGVGLGGAAGAVLLLPALSRLAARSRRTATTGAAAGVGPAVTGLATLGACCCTSCAGAAGISVVAAASGTTLSQLLVDDWYIGAFQIAVVAVSLLAQERALRLSGPGCPVPPPADRRFAVGAILRLGLLVAGVTWSLAMFVEWGTVDPLTAGAATWYHWLLEHQLLSGLAIAAALFPLELGALLRRAAGTVAGRVGRALLGLAAVTWAVGVPPFLAAAGLGGLLNEVLGFLGAPAGWGAVGPDAPLGAALLFHWVGQHLLLGGFALAVAVAPERALAPLAASAAGGRPSGSPAGPAGAPAAGWSPSLSTAPSAPPPGPDGL